MNEAQPLEAEPRSSDDREVEGTWRATAVAWLPGLVILGAVVWLVTTHFAEEHEFARLLSQSRPWWLLVAAIVQAGTYFTAGEGWRLSLRAHGQRLARRS